MGCTRLVGTFDKSTRDEFQTSPERQKQSRVEFSLDPETTNMKLVSRWRESQSTAKGDENSAHGRSTHPSTPSAVIYFTGSIIFRRRSIFSAPRALTKLRKPEKSSNFFKPLQYFHIFNGTRSRNDQLQHFASLKPSCSIVTFKRRAQRRRAFRSPFVRERQPMKSSSPLFHFLCGFAPLRDVFVCRLHRRTTFFEPPRTRRNQERGHTVLLEFRLQPGEFGGRGV
jgi:hypothetical protein